MLIISKINGKQLGNPIKLTEKQATIKDAKNIFDFQVMIQRTNEKKLFAVDSEAFIKEIISSKKSVIMMYYDEQKLVAISELNIPDDKKELDEYDIEKYKPNIDKNKIAIYESIAVIPEYRGNGIQYKCLQEMEKIAKSEGYEYIVGTVHPDNTYSYNNFIKIGYEVLAKTDFYYGYRYIMFKKI